MGSVSVLALLSSVGDRDALRSILSHSNWKLQFSESLEHTVALQREFPIGVAICDSVLAGGTTWKDALAAFEQAPNRPSLIVADATGDVQLWAEVLNLGAYDLLMTPFDSAEARRVISSAWRSWNHRARLADMAVHPVASASSVTEFRPVRSGAATTFAYGTMPRSSPAAQHFRSSVPAIRAGWPLF